MHMPGGLLRRWQDCLHEMCVMPCLVANDEAARLRVGAEKAGVIAACREGLKNNRLQARAPPRPRPAPALRRRRRVEPVGLSESV